MLMPTGFYMVTAYRPASIAIMSEGFVSLSLTVSQVNSLRLTASSAPIRCGFVFQKYLAKALGK